MSIQPVQTSSVINRKSAKPFLNLDLAVAFVLNASYYAMHGWLRGLPLDEIALLNRLTEMLKNNSCLEWQHYFDYSKYFLRRRLFVLHHKGTKATDGVAGTDAYGADLAITVNIFGKNQVNEEVPEDSVFSKTALFQMKRGKNFQAKLKLAQLNQSSKFVGHSFVLYADEEAAEYRIQSTSVVSAQLQQYPGKPVDTKDWLTLAEWLVMWLTCEIGNFSSDVERLVIESVMGNFDIDKKAKKSSRIQLRLPVNKKDGSLSGNHTDFITSDLPPAVTWLLLDIYAEIPAAS